MTQPDAREPFIFPGHFMFFSAPKTENKLKNGRKNVIRSNFYVINKISISIDWSDMKRLFALEFDQKTILALKVAKIAIFRQSVYAPP